MFCFYLLNAGDAQFAEEVCLDVCRNGGGLLWDGGECADVESRGTVAGEIDYYDGL